ncbi:hypothetical protein ACJ6WE_32015 [Streptomyces sp. MMS24-I31]|uniref:hypothetical protein n=1 Tax=Streptomyces sp. MMS24-I31 TaxID=3351563 RepID=UPI0038969D4F
MVSRQGRTYADARPRWGPARREAKHASRRAAVVVEAGRILAVAERPVILAGAGVVRAGARSALLGLAERLQAPAATTFVGRAPSPGNTRCAGSRRAEWAGHRDPGPPRL